MSRVTGAHQRIFHSCLKENKSKTKTLKNSEITLNSHTPRIHLHTRTCTHKSKSMCYSKRNAGRTQLSHTQHRASEWQEIETWPGENHCWTFKSWKTTQREMTSYPQTHICITMWGLLCQGPVVQNDRPLYNRHTQLTIRYISHTVEYYYIIYCGKLQSGWSS